MERELFGELWKQLRIWLRTLIRGVAESLWVLNIPTAFASVNIASCHAEAALECGTAAFSIFAQVSRIETVRLKTNPEGEASGSTQK